MGSLRLNCPLCCSETFSCHNSLKYHLLSITENLICPACGVRFEKIFDLAIHLGNECLDPPRNTDIQDVVVAKKNDVSTSHSKDDVSTSHTKDDVSTSHTKDDVSTSHTKDDDDNANFPDSILARALRKNKSPEVTVANDESEDTTLNGDEVYHCSSCTVNFTSIEEHIKEFHNGHEVFLEEENKNDSDASVYIVQEESVNNEENSETAVEEECSDKCGILYTRKLVKIEKFWDNVSEDDTDVIENNVISSDEEVNEVIQIYQCKVCSNKYASFEDFSKHNCKRKLAENISRKCHICGANFVNARYLTLHMRNHRPNIPDNTNPPFICDICNTELPSYKSLRLHKRMHDPIRSKQVDPPVNYGLEGEVREKAPREKFLCVICCKEYDKQYAEAHKRFHSAEKDYNCQICNRKFYSEENLEMHMHAHTEPKKYTCSYCKKGFLSNEKLEVHISTKCQMRQYECQYCGRRFSRPHEKVKHERIHTGEKPYKCEICGKAFRVSYCLTLHMRTHSGTRPYKCEHCGKRFKAHSVFNHHLMTHSEDRKYKCPFCPKTFKTGVQLAGHKNSHIKPFTCTECNRPFASLYAVRAHMATHKRQNNLKYKCWLCGASYARSFALRDHVKEQHFEEHESKDDSTSQLENVDYIISGSIEGGESILGDGDETMLIDITDSQDVNVNSMEISGVSITPVLRDNNDV